jgi:hypothetical protein
MHEFRSRAGNGRACVQLCGYRGLLIIQNIINLGQQTLGLCLALRLASGL